MSKMSEMSQVLDELISCGEGLVRAATALREMLSTEPGPVPIPQPEEVVVEAPAQVYTFAEVRKAFAAKSHAGYTDQIRDLIARYGADKLSAIGEENYPALMADLEAIA